MTLQLSQPPSAGSRDTLHVPDDDDDDDGAPSLHTNETLRVIGLLSRLEFRIACLETILSQLSNPAIPIVTKKKRLQDISIFHYFPVVCLPPNGLGSFCSSRPSVRQTVIRHCSRPQRLFVDTRHHNPTRLTHKCLY